MMMNEFFNGPRFLAYARKQYTENWKLYALGAAIVVLVIAGFFWLQLGEVKEGDKITYYLNTSVFKQGAFMFGTILMLVFLQWSTRDWRVSSRSTLSALTPASTFEKYGFVWLNTLVFYWVFFLLVFGAVYGIGSHLVEYKSYSYGSGMNYFDPLCLYALMAHAAGLFFFTLARKNSIWVYLVLYGIIMLSIGLIPSWLREWGVTNSYTQNPLYSIYVIRSEVFRYNASWIPFEVQPCVDSIAYCFLACTFWLSGYFKLKEKQLK